MKLLVQADDYGFTKGVTAGIVDAIENGFLRNTGMFTNMPTAVAAAKLIPNFPQACFGIDFNLVSGPSAADPKLIPSLVDENGEFIRSNIRINDPKWQTEEGRRELFPKDQVQIEMQAQYDRFIELTGQKPGYLHGHSISPETYAEVMLELAHTNGVPHSQEIAKKYNFFNPMRQDWAASKATAKKEFDPMDQVSKNPEGLFWEHREEALKHEYVQTVGHCGFVDAALFDLTSLSIERARDHQMVTSPRIMEWIKENNVELITYRDLV
ncbi:ChbG/HpnK family deacetylase [Eubacteriales bacterium OttesenSCG-928-M02]|nr:ChbG/HpnK family deacetylase [Eubacteriales bacterium OttesenSCG-928-M02]